jgi:hypothetical protein
VDFITIEISRNGFQAVVNDRGYVKWALNCQRLEFSKLHMSDKKGLIFSGNDCILRRLLKNQKAQKVGN